MRLRPQTVIFVQQFIITLVVLIILLAGTDGRFTLLSSRALYTGVLALAVLVVFMRRLRNWRILATPLDIGWLAFVALTGAGVLFAPNPRRALEPWLFSAAITLPIAYATVVLVRRGVSLTILFRGLLLSGFFIYLLTLPPIITWVNDVLAAQRVGVDARPFRLWGVMDNPAIFGMFLAIVTPVILAWAFHRGRRTERSAALIWCVLVIPLTVAHGTRSATIALLCSLAVTIPLIASAHPARPLQRWREGFRKHRARTVLISLFIVSLLIGGVGLVFYIQALAPSHVDPQVRLDLYRVAISAFREKPLTGWGPGSYVEAELRAFSYPPYALVPHAHNLLLHLAAENGVIGLAGLAILTLFAVISVVRAWLILPGERLLLAGLIGGLIGFVFCGVLDYPPRHPALVGLTTILLMTIVARLPVSRRVLRVRVMMLITVSVSIVAVTLFLLVLYGQQWNIFEKMGRALQTRDAAILADARAHADAMQQLDPNDPLAALQAAYLWANPRTPDELRTSIERFERAVALDGRSAVHWVNLSVLYRRAGDVDRGIEAARIGARQAKDSAVAWLTLGQHFEAANHRQSAQDAYLRALQLAPHWRAAAFWKEDNHPARRAALEHYRGWAATQKPTVESALRAGDAPTALTLATTPEEALTAKGFIALRDARNTQAAELFRQTLQMNPTGNILAFAQLGRQRATGIPAPNVLLSSGVNGPGARSDLTYAHDMFWRIGIVNDWIEGTGQLDWTLGLEQLMP